MGLWLEPIEMPESGHSWGSLDDEACSTRLRPQTGMAIGSPRGGLEIYWCDERGSSVAVIRLIIANRTTESLASCLSLIHPATIGCSQHILHTSLHVREAT